MTHSLWCAAVTHSLWCAAVQWANSEVGFCVLGVASVVYVFAWPIVLFSVCIEDSRFVTAATLQRRTPSVLIVAWR